MIQPGVGFIVYGVHKDGLSDPMGAPFIDDAVVSRSRDSLRSHGLKVIDYPVVVASKTEARAALAAMKRDDERRLRRAVLRYLGMGRASRRGCSGISSAAARQSFSGRTRDRKAGGRWAGSSFTAPSRRSGFLTGSSTGRLTIRWK